MKIMQHTLFISDLHLCTSRPQINQLFFSFLANQAVQAESVYVLGDLFEYWAGDDDIADPFNAKVIAAFSALTKTGVKLFLMHGNRDFLIGPDFARACNATLLNDPTLINLYGKPTLLTHGDTLCTDDSDYQNFRKQVRNRDWQKKFLSQPLAARKAAIENMRAQSEQQKQIKSMEIMDVNQTAVDALLREYNYPRLIHGHTHRPAKHLHQVDGKTCERWVLSDWCGHGQYLYCDAQDCHPITINT
jgi:UDP-2,3-diacylglucosamine hydrolase